MTVEQAHRLTASKRNGFPRDVKMQDSYQELAGLAIG